MNYQLISIVLPVHNQADHISHIVKEYEAALLRVPGRHELLLITNGCHDNSWDNCCALASQYSSVRAVNIERAGWGLAVNLGLREAKGDLLCYTNSSRTSPQDLTLLLQYALAYPNVVIKANRKIRDNWRRRFGSLLYNFECRTLFDLSCWDINGTPKVFPRAFDGLMSLTRKDDVIDAEFNAICRREGYPMIEVPIFSTHRHGGKSTTNYSSAVQLYWGAYQLWRSMRASSD